MKGKQSKELNLKKVRGMVALWGGQYFMFFMCYLSTNVFKILKLAMWQIIQYGCFASYIIYHTTCASLSPVKMQVIFTEINKRVGILPLW